MADPCCNDQRFTRDADPVIADIGSVAGAEFTIGSCASCSHPLIDVFVSAASESIIVPAESDLIASLINAPEANTRKEMLEEWWESR